MRINKKNFGIYTYLIDAAIPGSRVVKTKQKRSFQAL